MNIAINCWSVLVAAVASMVVGSIWYGPLFGKKFMHATGMNEWSPEKQATMKKKMIPTYLFQFAASFVMFYVFAWIVGATGQMTVMGGLSAALCLWIGFIVPIKLGDALWGGKMSLFWIGIGNMLVTLLIGGAIIGGWQ